MLTNVECLSKQWSQGQRKDHCRRTATHKVDHQKGEGGHCWECQFVSPPEVQDIVSKPKENHATDTQQRRTEVLEVSEVVEVWIQKVVNKWEWNTYKHDGQIDSTAHNSKRLWSEVKK